MMGFLRRAANVFIALGLAILIATNAWEGAYAQGGAGPTAPRAEDDNGYRLGAGDKLHITVIGDSDLTKDYQVDGTGVVSFPFIGSLKAAGLSTRAFQAELKAKLDDGYFRDARVTVDIINYRPYYIYGEVKSPQAYPFVAEMTVINAIVLAGGYTDRAFRNRIYIRHYGSNEEIPARESTKISPGDVIRIPERYF
jgi:protein involved in polysaccharide export with SLBB domain